MDAEGTAYVTLHPSMLVKITRDGEQTILVGENSKTPLFNPTSATLSRDGRKLYVVIGGSTVDGKVEGGQVVEVCV